jgi:hypothetical protein
MKILGIAVAALIVSLPAAAADFSTGLQVGQVGGKGGQVQIAIDEFAQNFPASLRWTAGYARRDPGDPLGARRVFINDNTNGTPDEQGSLWQFGMDFVIPVRTVKGQPLDVYFGPRYSRFLATFDFIGGNEIFDITSRQWGWGFGLESRFAMGDRAALLLSAGVETYLDAEISGHDTAYSPDDEPVNGRNDYTFDDADEVIDQPQWEPRLLIGVTWGL